MTTRIHDSCCSPIKRSWGRHLIFKKKRIYRSTLKLEEKRKSNKTLVPSMIHSARPTFKPVAITILAWTLFCFARYWKVGTDGRTDERTDNTCEIMITTGRDCGPASWINLWILINYRISRSWNILDVMRQNFAKLFEREELAWL